MMNIHGRAALLVVDFQGGELSGPFATYTQEQAAKARSLVSLARAKGVPVVWVQEVHKSHLIDIGRELDGSEGPHCIEGSPHTELVTGLVPRPDEFHITKRRYSGFFGTELDIVLRSHGVDSLILIGGFTDICILYTSVDAHQRDFHVNVVTDVVAGSSAQAHDDALTMIRHLQHRALVASADVESWLAGVDAPAAS